MAHSRDRTRVRDRAYGLYRAGQRIDAAADARSPRRMRYAQRIGALKRLRRRCAFSAVPVELSRADLNVNGGQMMSHKRPWRALAAVPAARPGS